jgi:hypothetical protein
LTGEDDTTGSIPSDSQRSWLRDGATVEKLLRC